MPTGLQLFFVFLLGVSLAAFANYAVDLLGLTRRSRSPWRSFPKELVEQGVAPRRSWGSLVPIWGWFELGRLSACKKETPQERTFSKPKRGKRGASAESVKIERAYSTTPGWESQYFWVRPALVEILFTALVLWRFVYWRGVTFVDSHFYFGESLVYWGAETTLFWFALCASLVDLDDYVIPDLIVLPCACLGLILATLFPYLIVFPVNWPLDFAGKESTFSVVAFASQLVDRFGVEPNYQVARLYVGAALTLIWSFWSFALLDRRFHWRLGFKRATSAFFRRLARSPLTRVVGILWTLGLVGIWFVVLTTPGGVFTRLDALTNSFVGLLVGTTLIWCVRLVGGSALGVEAMGFGDVVLSGALGAFIGWQGAVVVFFLAPFFGLFFGLSRRIVNTEREIPYGPFLCMATLCYVVWRQDFFKGLAPYFGDPVFVVGVGAVGLVLLAVLLFIIRIGKGLVRR